jgi:hypothetical protein
MLQKILDKVNKSDNIMLTGDMNTRVGILKSPTQ